MIQLGRDDQFLLVRNYLRERYTDEIVAAALGARSLTGFTDRDPRKEIRDPLARLFFAGAAVPLSDVRAAMPAPVLDAFGSLGLLRFADDQNRYLWCTVVLYPLGGLHFVSDRMVFPDGSAMSDPDFVYFALTPNTLRYLNTLPEYSCESFLDVGGGCGAAALLQSRYAAHAVASDISPKSTLYAEFNRRLNGIANVEVVQGSIYDPVGDRQFDRIGCHPPYDLSTTVKWTFADGGDDGEMVIRSAVEGLPKHLAPGGEFIAQFRAADIVNVPLEQRLRSWLGERHSDFDVVLVVRETSTVHEHLFDAVLKANAGLDVYHSCLKRFSERGVQQLVYGSVLIRRKQFGSAAVTVRKNVGRRCGYAELRWALDAEQARAPIDVDTVVLRVSPDVEVDVKHRVNESGHLLPTDYKLVCSTPFSEELTCSQWLAVLLSEFDGRRTGADVFQRMQQHGPVEPAQFEAAVQRLVAMSVLRA